MLSWHWWKSGFNIFGLLACSPALPILCYLCLLLGRTQHSDKEKREGTCGWKNFIKELALLLIPLLSSHLLLTHPLLPSFPTPNKLAHKYFSLSLSLSTPPPPPRNLSFP